MNTSDLVKALAHETAVTQETAKTTVDTLIDIIAATLKEGNEVALTGLGSFTVKTTSARTGRNPRTGESVQIAAGRKVAFKPSSILKKSL